MNKNIYHCHKCYELYSKNQIYINERAPHYNFCKKCLDKEIQNNIIKAIPYLHKYRIPVCPEIWEEYKRKCNGKPIFGKYINRMKMCSWWPADFLAFFDKNNKYPKVRRAWKDYIINYIEKQEREINELAGTPSMESIGGHP